MQAKNGHPEHLKGYKTLLEMCEKCNGFAEVFPEHKFEIVKILQVMGGWRLEKVEKLDK